MPCQLWHTWAIMMIGMMMIRLLEILDLIIINYIAVIWVLGILDDDILSICPESHVLSGDEDWNDVDA